MTVRVIFSRRHHPGSVALRTFMWSPWSHCGVIDGNYVVQATSTHGVGYTLLEDFKKDASEWAILEFPADEWLTLQAMRSQIGKPYDWLGCAGIFFHRRWEEEDAWFCSELVVWALAQGGCNLFRIDARRITPQHLWMLDFPLVDWKGADKHSKY